MTAAGSRAAGCAALLVFVVAAPGCRDVPEADVETERVVTVTVAPATRGEIVGIVRATGVVAAAPGAELTVIAPQAARIAELPRGVGDRVRRGDLLVRFEIPGAAAEVQRQQAEVGKAQAAVAQADAARARAGALFERGIAARREVEDGERAMVEATSQLAEARAGLAAAESMAGWATVRATFDGVVAARLHNPGDLVEAAAADPVLRVVDPARLEVVASVALGDAARIAAGARARIVSGGGEHPPALTVRTRPAAVDAGSATLPVRLGPAPAGLPVGAPVQVAIDAERHRDVVLVPAAAVVRDGEETAVLVAVDGKAHRKVVTLGLADGERVEIAEGVDAGDQVIVDGQAGLPDDAAIAVAPREGAAR